MEETLAVRKLDRLGAVLVAAGIIATALLPFIYVKANRIASGKPMLLTQLLDHPSIIILAILLVATAFAALFAKSAPLRLAIATLGLAALVAAIGLVASAFTPPNSNAARMTPEAVSGCCLPSSVSSFRMRSSRSV